MALTKISRGLLNTGVSDSSDATAITIDSSENITTAGTFQVGGASTGNLKITGGSDVISVTAKKDGTDDIDLAFHTQASGGVTGEKMRIASDGQLSFNSGFGSVGKAYGVRAWVRFRGDTSGTGNRQVDGSGNVSTVGYTAAGRYRMNFSNNMPDVHYAVAASGIGVTNHNPIAASIDAGYSTNVGYVDLAYGPSGGTGSYSFGSDSGTMYNAIIVR